MNISHGSRYWHVRSRCDEI